MSIIQRKLQKKFSDYMGFFPTVYINGPRQAGKTTLARKLIKESLGFEFISFDNALELSAAKRNPYNFIEQAGTPLIIDEVQMAPEVFRPLKMLIDEKRLEALDKGNKKPNGSYILTGSANLLAILELADAMVGRMATLTLLPLSCSEVFGNNTTFFERCFSKDFSSINYDKVTLNSAIKTATFPEIYNADEDIKRGWFDNYIHKVTLEDPKHLYNLEKAELMPILLQILASRAGSLVNDASVGREIGLNATTTRNYRGLLTNSFITHSLKPWYRNISKRLVKSSKIYLYDTLLLCHLLGSNVDMLAKEKPQLYGHILENFVLTELMKNNCWTKDTIDISFYRTNDGREVDFVLEKNHKIVAIEVKNSEKITDKDLAGIKELQLVTKDDFVCGIVLCNTKRVIAYDKDIFLVPFSTLWN